MVQAYRVLPVAREVQKVQVVQEFLVLLSIPPALEAHEDLEHLVRQVGLFLQGFLETPVFLDLLEVLIFQVVLSPQYHLKVL